MNTNGKAERVVEYDRAGYEAFINDVSYCVRKFTELREALREIGIEPTLAEMIDNLKSIDTLVFQKLMQKAPQFAGFEIEVKPTMPDVSKPQGLGIEILRSYAVQRLRGFVLIRDDEKHGYIADGPEVEKHREYFEARISGKQLELYELREKFAETCNEYRRASGEPVQAGGLVTNVRNGQLTPDTRDFIPPSKKRR